MFFFQGEDVMLFFFKQKTAYDIGVRLVGSEMCIRDSIKTAHRCMHMNLTVTGKMSEP